MCQSCMFIGYVVIYFVTRRWTSSAKIINPNKRARSALEPKLNGEKCRTRSNNGLDEKADQNSSCQKTPMGH